MDRARACPCLNVRFTLLATPGSDAVDHAPAPAAGPSSPPRVRVVTSAPQAEHPSLLQASHDIDLGLTTLRCLNCGVAPLRYRSASRSAELPSDSQAMLSTACIVRSSGPQSRLIRAGQRGDRARTATSAFLARARRDRRPQSRSAAAALAPTIAFAACARAHTGRAITRRRRSSTARRLDPGPSFRRRARASGRDGSQGRGAAQGKRRLCPARDGGRSVAVASRWAAARLRVGQRRRGVESGGCDVRRRVAERGPRAGTADVGLRPAVRGDHPRVAAAGHSSVAAGSTAIDADGHGRLERAARSRGHRRGLEPARRVVGAVAARRGRGVAQSACQSLSTDALPACRRRAEAGACAPHQRHVDADRRAGLVPVRTAQGPSRTIRRCARLGAVTSTRARQAGRGSCVTGLQSRS